METGQWVFEYSANTISTITSVRVRIRELPRLPLLQVAGGSLKIFKVREDVTLRVVVWSDHSRGLMLGLDESVVFSTSLILWFHDLVIYCLQIWADLYWVPGSSVSIQSIFFICCILAKYLRKEEVSLFPFIIFYVIPILMLSFFAVLFKIFNYKHIK